MSNVIELRNISKSFGSKSIYQDVSLEVSEGECIGFVGKNGAGKSVLFQIMTGLLKPDAGEVYVNGVKLGERGRDFPENIGILINEPGYVGYQTGFRNLQMLAQIKDIIDDDDIRETMKLVGLNPDDKTPVRKYSMGMKQKLGIAQAIMENQSIIILDEPFNALDYDTNRDISKTLQELEWQGKTILLTSHQHQYLEKLCDRICFINEGKIVPFDDEIKAKYFEV